MMQPRAFLTLLPAGLAVVGGAARAQAAPDLLAEVRPPPGKHPAVLRGEFEQTKTIKGFKRPLVSKGSFVMAAGKGVLWVTAQPFASTGGHARAPADAGRKRRQPADRHAPGAGPEGRQ